MRMVARLLKISKTKQKMSPCNSEALIRGFELIISGNHAHESLRSRGMFSSFNLIQYHFISFFGKV